MKNKSYKESSFVRASLSSEYAYKISYNSYLACIFLSALIWLSCVIALALYAVFKIILILCVGIAISLGFWGIRLLIARRGILTRNDELPSKTLLRIIVYLSASSIFSFLCSTILLSVMVFDLYGHRPVPISEPVTFIILARACYLTTKQTVYFDSLRKIKINQENQ